MCLNLLKLADGQLAKCQKCWQCLRDKVDDWTGRCIAEGQTSVAAHAATFTYGRDAHYDAADHVRAAALTYSDVQKMLKRLRRDGLEVRYFVVGEYGSTKGRAHWHGLFFWKNAVPIVRLGENFDFHWWDHGHTFWDRLSPEAIRYACKYVAKEVTEDGAMFHMGMSRHPPLGDEYFRLLARRYVADRLAPQDWYYSFPDVRKKDKQQRFQMQGTTRRNFLRYFRDGWWAEYGDHPPNSEILDDFEDREAEAGSQDTAKRVLAAEKMGLLSLRDSVPHEGVPQSVKKPADSDLRSWMTKDRLVFSEHLNVWLYRFDGEQRPWYWTMDEAGDWGWHAVIGARARNATPSYLGVKRGER